VRIKPAGRSALVLDCADAAESEAWRTELWRRRDAGELAVCEIVAGARTVLLDGVDAGAAAAIEHWTPRPDAGSRAGAAVEIPTTFDGDDLADVAARWEVTEEEAVTRLTGIGFVVAFCGFAPGFAYLRGLPDAWAVPRLATPRKRVPAGSVGLADAYAGVYPSASPGGWRLVGRTTAPLFDVRREEPALLAPGTRVRLVRA
jgi:KipI family sensor histidine kinase inhibitor